MPATMIIPATTRSGRSAMGLASFWALVLRRFRAFAQRSSAADRDRQREGR